MIELGGVREREEVECDGTLSKVAKF